MLTFSYTEMARRHAPAFLAGSTDVSPVNMDADEFDKWLAQLPSSVRTSVENGLKQIAQSLPPLAQVQLAKAIIASGHQSPVGLPLEGLGCDCVPGTSGLGQWGALASGIIQAGAGIYTNKLSNDMQQSVANDSAKQDANIVKAQADAAIKTQKLLADAQVKAAQALAKSSAQKAQAHAPVLIAGISVLGIAGIAALVIYLKRKNRKT